MEKKRKAAGNILQERGVNAGHAHLWFSMWEAEAGSQHWSLLVYIEFQTSQDK